MKISIPLTLLLTLTLTFNLSAGPDVPPSLGKKGELLFSDDFERTELGDWKVIIPRFKVEEGVLVATQERDDHGAVGRVYKPMKDVIVSFRFKLAGSPGFNLVFDDKNHKGSHAGHICRVAVVKNQIRLGDDKEGVMRNDIFAMRKDPSAKAKADELLEGRGSKAKVTVESEKWYSMTIEVKGEEMRASLDGTALIYLKSPGIAHPTKESIHFTVNGTGAHFDDVRIWKVKE